MIVIVFCVHFQIMGFTDKTIVFLGEELSLRQVTTGSCVNVLMFWVAQIYHTAFYPKAAATIRKSIILNNRYKRRPKSLQSINSDSTQTPSMEDL
eukprot:UN20808